MRIPPDDADNLKDKTVDEVPFVFGETGLATPAVIRRAAAAPAPTALIEAVRPQVIGAVPVLRFTGTADSLGRKFLDEGNIYTAQF